MERARAISTICRCPGGIDPTRREGGTSSPTRASSSRALSGHAAGDQQAEQAGLLAAQEEVGLDAQVFRQVEFLVDQHDAPVHGVRHAVQAHRRAVQQQDALVGREEAGHDLHERGLAGPVLADDGQRLARHEAQAHPVQRLHAGERLADAARFQEGCAHYFPISLSSFSRNGPTARRFSPSLSPASFWMTRNGTRTRPSLGSLLLSPSARAAIIFTDW